MIPRANFSAQSLRAPPDTTPPSILPARRERDRDKVDPRERVAFLLNFVGWTVWLLTWYCYDQAQPVEFKIDRLFGVIRPHGWDTSLLTAGLGLAFLAVVLGGASLAVTYSRQQRAKDFRSPVAPLILIGLSLLSGLFLGLRLL